MKEICLDQDNEEDKRTPRYLNSEIQVENLVGSQGLSFEERRDFVRCNHPFRHQGL